MFIQEDDLKLNDWQFSQRKYLPYKVKKTLAERRIKEWYYNWDGQVYLSYSGGLDSTALLHMIRKTVGLEVPAVFSNTGLEFPEIVRFARQASGEFVEIYPRWKDGSRLTFKQVVEKYGFPLISKETALKIRKLRHGNLSDRYRNYLMNGDERGKFGMLPKKWRFLLDTQFDISEQCCNITKKKPFKDYGIEMDIRKTARVEYTLSNIVSEEWIIADETNCPELGGKATFSFGEAIKYLKRGKKVKREGWNGKNQYIQLATGISYKTQNGEIVNCEHDAIGNIAVAFVGTSGVQMGWLTSQADMLADDWMFVE